MPSIGPSFFLLSLVVAFVVANETSTLIAVTPFITTTSTTFNMTSFSIATSARSSSITPSTTKQEGHSDSGYKTPKMSSATKPTVAPEKATATKKTKDKRTTAKPRVEESNLTGIIILIIILLVALSFGVVCFVVRRRGRRQSVDLTSRPDEANIPLSPLEPVLPLDTVSQNGLQTFESAEDSTSKTNEREAKLVAQDEQKAEADKTVVDPSTETAALPPDSSVDKPKEDDVDRSPAAPAESSAEEKTDDGVSGKTSEESLKETNENSSNNADLTRQMELKTCSVFWEDPLDWPV